MDIIVHCLHFEGYLYKLYSTRVDIGISFYNYKIVFKCKFKNLQVTNELCH